MITEIKKGDRFICITIKPESIDSDLAQELVRENIDCKEYESVADASIREAGLAGAKAGESWRRIIELLKVADAAGKLGVKPKTEPMNTDKFNEAIEAFHKSIDELKEAISREFPVKPASILIGKCAIQVNNEREFKLLMRHYEDKGWKAISGDCPLKTGFINSTWSYKDKFAHALNQWRVEHGYTVIPFAAFAKEVGIKAPVFVMKSEDGVDLYEGDYVWTTRCTRAGKGHCTWNIPLSKVMTPAVCIELDVNRDNVKAFHAEGAAQAWIKEQNKPNVIRLSFEGGEAIITKDKIRVHLDSEGGKGYFMEATEIEPIYSAYKSLQ